MDTLKFLETVLPTQGIYVAYTSKGPKKDNVYKQSYYEQIDGLIERGQEAKRIGWDAYFALATFPVKGTRKAKDAAYLKSLFLDVDCGEGKPYATREDGIRALVSFCKTYKLPKPLLTSSGRGVHVYWPFAQEVTKEEWQKVAWKLDTLIKAAKFEVDNSITCNAASVLRTPGTSHFKSEPRPVEIINGECTPQPFSFYQSTIGEESRQKQLFKPRELDPVTQALLGSYTNSFKLILKKTNSNIGCNQLKDLITNQATMDEPKWRAALSIAAFTVEADKAIHIVSRNHPEYDPVETEQKAAQIKGPFLCDTFEKYNPGKCEGCIHRGQIRSPITLGRSVAEAKEETTVVTDHPTDLPEEYLQQYTIPKYPAPYFRGQNGGVFKREAKKAPDGAYVEVEKSIYHNDFYVVKRLMDAELGECAVMRLHLPKDGVREFTISNALSTEELRKKLAMQGIAVNKMDEIKAYVVAWFNYLQFLEKSGMTHMQFGWVKKEEQRLSFVVGNKEFSPQGIEHSPPSSKTIDYMHFFTQAGTLDKWKETMQFFTDKPNSEMHKFIIGCGFGSLFMDFSAVHGLGVHVYSADSGYGKTTAMLAGASIWGDPSLVMMKHDDTHASRMARTEVFKNICMYFDEMTNIDGKEASHYAYSIPNGLQRARMESNSNKERWRGLPWKTIAISTGNTKLSDRMRMEKAAPNAEMYRILEIEAVKGLKLRKEDTDILAKAINTNYGHAHIPFLQWVMRNLKETEELWTQVRLKLDKEANLSYEDRFYSAGCASSLTGLIIAKKLGLIDWNVAEVFKWVVKIIGHASVTREEAKIDPLHIIGQYWAENFSNTLSIRSTEDARKDKNELLEQIVMPDSTPRMALKLRYEYDVKTLFIAVDAFRDWCGKKSIVYDPFVKALIQSAKAEIKSKRMAKGTRMNIPPTSAIVLYNMDAMTDVESPTETTT